MQADKLQIIFRPQKVHMELESSIQKLDFQQGNQRNHFTTRAIKKYNNTSLEKADIDKIRQELSNAKTRNQTDKLPTSVQIYLNQEDISLSEMNDAAKKVQEEFEIPKKLQMQYFVQILWAFYLWQLKLSAGKKEETEPKNPSETNELTSQNSSFPGHKTDSTKNTEAFEERISLIKKFTDMVYQNREEDQKIIQAIKALLD